MVLPEDPVKGVTNLFLLENIIWLCLEFFLDENHKVVRLIPEDDRGGCPDTLGWVNSGSRMTLGGPFRRQVEKALLETLKAELRMEPQAGEIDSFPAKKYLVAAPPDGRTPFG